jgi:hypothetical protein
MALSQRYVHGLDSSMADLVHPYHTRPAALGRSLVALKLFKRLIQTKSAAAHTYMTDIMLWSYEVGEIVI